VLDYAEIKALAIGNPLIKERVEVSNEFEHAKICQRQKRKEINSLKDILKSMPFKVKTRKALINNAKADKEFYSKCKQVIPMEKRQQFGEFILSEVNRNVMKDKERVIKKYQGFDVVLPKYMSPDKPYVILRRFGSNSYSIKMDGDKALGVCRRLDYVLDNLDDTVKRHEEALADLFRQQENAAKSIIAGNEFDKQVDDLYARLCEIDKELKEDKAS